MVCEIGLLLQGSQYRLLFIDSESRIDTCLQKLGWENYLSAEPDELNMKEEMLETFVCA